MSTHEYIFSRESSQRSICEPTESHRLADADAVIADGRASRIAESSPSSYHYMSGDLLLLPADDFTPDAMKSTYVISAGNLYRELPAYCVDDFCYSLMKADIILFYLLIDGHR